MKKIMYFGEMKIKFKLFNLICLTGLLAITGFTTQATEDNAQSQPPLVLNDAKITTAKPRLSRPVSQISNPLPKLTKARINKMQQSGEKVPGRDFIREVPNKNHPFAARHIQQNKKFKQDSVLQSKAYPMQPGKFTPVVGVGFNGMDNVQGSVPPDTNADVGPNHIVQMVNTAIAIWDKSGNQLLAPVAINSIWEGFGGICETNNQGDPIVLYDSQADRWLISQFAFNESFTDNHQCIAISQTPDPTGAYYLYDFLWSTTKFNDYPHYGVWHDGYYAGINQFTGDKYTGAAVVVYERDKMLLGETARQIKFDLENQTPDAFTPMPADIDGLYLPPDTMPQYFVSAGGDANTIDVWTFDANWADPERSVFKLQQTLNVAPYNGGVCEFNRNCIRQPNSQRLDAIGQRMMFRLAYRNLYGEQHKLVGNHTVVGSSSSNTIAGVRWYEMNIDATSEDVSIANQGTYNLNDGNSRWMGSAAMDAVGNIGVAYSVSGPNLNPSIRFSGRYATDTANVLSVPEDSLKEGEGAQSGSERWGDYSSLSVDPVDDCTMWYTTEYYKATNNNTSSWSTYIGSFRFDDCVAGPSGRITGVITNSETNEPIPGVEVSSGNFRVYSNEDGEYRLVLPVDTGYPVKFYKYGWVNGQIASIDIAEDDVLNRDIQLTPATPIKVSGTVRDGSGLNTPLYSEIIVDIPGGSVSTFTDPITGQYEINLYGGNLLKMHTKVHTQGYQDESRDIDPVTTQTANFALTIFESCIAAGYKVSGLIEGFEAGVPPLDWTVEDKAGSGSIWQSTANTRGNLIGTSGHAAIADSDLAGQDVNTDTSLISPVISVASMPSTQIEFDTLYRALGDEFDFDIKVDGGNWVNLLKIKGDGLPEHVTLDLAPSISGASSFQLRWHYYRANWNWWALVDNVKITGSQCNPATGSFVQGNVIDANTGEALNDVLITNGQSKTISRATQDDDSVGDGYFRLFLENGASQNVNFTFAQYVVKQVAANQISLASPVALDAGKIEIASAPSAFEVPLDTIREDSLTIKNVGNVATNVEYLVTAVPTNKKMPSEIHGPYHPSTRHFGPKALKQLTTKKIRYSADFNSLNIATSAVDYIRHFDIQLTYPYGIAINQSNGNFWIGDVKAGGAAKDIAHQFNSDGVATQNTIDTTSISGDFAADMTFNNRTGKLWQVEVGRENCIHELNPESFSVTGNKICPEFGTSQRGLAYDPVSDTYYAGSWNDSVIHQFTADGTILRSVNVQLKVGGLAINPMTGSLFVLLNDEEPSKDVVVLDTNTDELTPITSFDMPKDIDLDGDKVPDDSLGDLKQGGIAIDCNGTLWFPSRELGVVVGVSSGEVGICAWAGVPWLILSNGYSEAIDASAEKSIDLAFNTTELELGTYKAQLNTITNTPYGNSTTLITLNVIEPQKGKVKFEVATAEATEEQEASFTINRVDGSDSAISINYKTVDGTAKAGTDYTAVEGQLNWADFDTEPKTIKVPLLTVHQNKSFTIKLFSDSPEQEVLLTDNSEITITIKDQPKGSGSVSYILILLMLLGVVGARSANQSSAFKPSLTK
ncbi:Calx-beta domain-containing protein [Aliikangiella maris]|uniref:Calx-beta domain-containing protein n=2 Tax=Aliikangiella maris TaxID=3162458 RepID=A0ABV3MNJ4_9GAMM